MTSKSRFLGLLILVLLACPVAGTAQSAATSNPLRKEIALEPGDVLKITIWREEDLSGEFPINERGLVILPLLGERQVAGVPLHTLRDTLIADYRVQLRNPSIEITPLRRVHVLGEVAKPGLYQVDPTISLAGVIAMAGGATQSGDLRRIRVLRDGEVLRERIAVESTLQTADIRSNDQVFVEPRNWFERNIPFVVGVMFSVTGIVLQLLR